MSCSLAWPQKLRHQEQKLVNSLLVRTRPSLVSPDGVWLPFPAPLPPCVSCMLDALDEEDGLMLLHSPPGGDREEAGPDVEPVRIWNKRRHKKGNVIG